MTEVNGYRSTQLTQDWMEQSHSVAESDGKKLDWRADHPSLMDGLHAEHEAPTEAARTLVEKFLLPKLVSGIKSRLMATSGAGAAGAGAASGAKSTLRDRALEAIENGVKATAGRLAPAVMEGAAGAAGALAVGAAAAEWVHASIKGDDLRHLSDLDTMDVAVTCTLDLDVGFKQADLAKHPNIVPEKAIAFMVTSDFGKQYKPELQAAADEGSRCAFDALRCGGKDAYLKLNPEAAKRLAGDIAFNKGFESVIWSAAQRDGEARLESIRKGIDARDVRATQSYQQVRG